MFEVTLSYTIRYGQREVQITGDQWLSKNPVEEEAIREAQADAELVVRTSYGHAAEVTYTSVVATPLANCGTCEGQGRVASMSGFYQCPTCKGQKYQVVMYGAQEPS